MTGLLIYIILNQINPGKWLTNCWWAVLLAAPVAIIIQIGEHLGDRLVAML